MRTAYPNDGRRLTTPGTAAGVSLSTNCDFWKEPSQVKPQQFTDVQVCTDRTDPATGNASRTTVAAANFSRLRRHYSASFTCA